MALDPTRIRLRTAGKLAKTTYVNEVAEALNGFGGGGNGPPLGHARPGDAPGFFFIGEIVDKGPDNEDDRTDETYWVQKRYVLTSQDDYVSTEKDETETKDDDTAAYSIKLVTNLVEQTPGSEGQGGHSLAVHRLVRVWGEPDAAGNVRWVMMEGGAGALPYPRPIYKPLMPINLSGDVAFFDYVFP